MKIQLKRSLVTEGDGFAKKPEVTQMEYGELAVNYGAADPAIFLKDSANNIIRISGRETPSDSTPPENPLPGNFWFNPEDGRLYIYYKDVDSSQWVDASPDSEYSPITTGPGFPPAENSKPNDLFFNSTDGRLYIFYKDINSEQWIDASPDSTPESADFWKREGTLLYPSNVNNSIGIGGTLPGDPAIELNTDGSINASNGVITSINNFDITNPASVGVNVAAGGIIQVKRNNGGVSVFSGFNGVTETSTITSDGSITAAGGNFILYTGGEVDNKQISCFNDISNPNNGKGKVSGYHFQGVSSSNVQTFEVLNESGSITAAGQVRSEAENVSSFVSDKTTGYHFYAADVNTVKFTVDGDGSITAAGQGTFSGDLRVQDGGNFRVRNASDAGQDAVLLENDGSITAVGALTNGSPTDYVGTYVGTSTGTDLYGVLNNDQNWRINGDGSASFAGNLALDFSAGTTGECFRIKSGNDRTVQINGNGSAFFSSNVNVGSDLILRASDATVYSASGKYTISGVDGSATFALGNIGFSADGSAIFAGDVRAEKVITDRDGTQVCFSARGGGAENAAIKADGSASFAGEVLAGGDWTDSPDNTQNFVSRISGVGCFKFRSNTGAGSIVDFHSQGSNTDSIVAKIMYDGSATFAGTKAWITSDGNFFLGDGGSVDTVVGNRRVFLYSNGNANFSGTVTANGNVLTRNVVLNLEADDDDKYTSTTNEEGEQTRVYNGATLDVKERLQKTDAALGSLKTALASISDFAQLKAALVTALADI